MGCTEHHIPAGQLCIWCVEQGALFPRADARLIWRRRPPPIDPAQAPTGRPDRARQAVSRYGRGAGGHRRRSPIETTEA